MLKHLQKSVEEEELVWKSKMSNSEEQLQEVSDNAYLSQSRSEVFSAAKFPSIIYKTKLQYLVALPGFAESQQAGSRKPKYKTGEDFSTLFKSPPGVS